MKVAAGRSFFERFDAEARAVAPDLKWGLMDTDGSWSDSPQGSELIVLAAREYSAAFIDATLAIDGVRWAHTEDAGVDGRFYDVMREKGVGVTHSAGTNAPEVAEFAIGLLLWSAKRLGELRDQQRSRVPVEGLIGRDALARMRPAATLINVGRGALVDVPALVEALEAGRLRGACLDVLPTEPWPADDALWDVEGLFVTPHNAYSSPQYLERVGALWLENLRRYIAGDSLLHRAF